MSKNKQELAFYSIPEFDEWKKNTENYKTWHIKYYKGEFLRWRFSPWRLDCVSGPPWTICHVAVCEERPYYPFSRSGD